ELLIELVKTKAESYDLSSPRSSDNVAKRRSWEEMGSQLDKEGVNLSVRAWLPSAALVGSIRFEISVRLEATNRVNGGTGVVVHQQLHIPLGVDSRTSAGLGTSTRSSTLGSSSSHWDDIAVTSTEARHSLHYTLDVYGRRADISPPTEVNVCV
ncbi:hypothetical protein Hamer_G007223, partial [Homarus americanus]